MFWPGLAWPGLDRRGCFISCDVADQHQIISAGMTTVGQIAGICSNLHLLSDMFTTYNLLTLYLY